MLPVCTVDVLPMYIPLMCFRLNEDYPEAACAPALSPEDQLRGGTRFDPDHCTLVGF